MKISYKVPLIAAGVIVVAFATFGTIQYRMAEKSIYQQMENNITEMSKVLNSELTQWLNKRLQIVQAMSELIGEDVSENHIIDIMSTDTYRKEALYYYATLADGDGGVISHHNFQGIPDDFDGRTRPWYKLAETNAKAMMTAPYVDAESGDLVTSAATPLRNERLDIIGVLSADFSLKEVSKAVNSVNFNNTGYVFLVDETGSIIAHPEKTMRTKNITELYDSNQSMLQRLEDNTIKGRKIMTAFFPLDKYWGSEKSWYLGIVLEKDKVLAPAKKLAVNTIISTIIAAIAALLIFSWFMSSALIKPVHQIAEQANAISRGKLNNPITGVGRKDEIGELAQAVQRMQKALSIAMNKLQGR